MAKKYGGKTTRTPLRRSRVTINVKTSSKRKTKCARGKTKDGRCKAKPGPKKKR